MPSSQPAVPEDLLARLNPEQARAAAAVTGPVRILAGAGTGKTRTITHRVAAQLVSGAFVPSQILAVTFTERAAAEMRDRIAALCSELGMDGVSVRAVTFHAAAWAQVRHFWPHLSDEPLPEVLGSKIPLLIGTARRLNVDAGDLASEVEWAANAGLDAEAVAASGRDELLDAATLAEVVRGYQDEKARRGAIDYEDMLRLSRELMDLDEPAASIRDRYRAFTVDEFQDTNALQWNLLRAWAGDRDDVCVVGDPAQTIFSFTGADARYLQNFPKAYPGTTSVQLNRSYRSTAQVLTLANRVLGRRAADLVPTIESEGAPEALLLERADDEAEQAVVVKAIQTLQKADVPLSEMAICYRINAQAAAWEEALREAGIRVSVRGEGSFYSRAEVTQAIGALVRAATATPPPAGTVAPPVVDAPVANPNVIAHVEEVLRDALAWRPNRPPQGRRARERWETIEAIRDEAAGLADDGLDLVGIAEELKARAASGSDRTAEAVTLMSMHRAKGTEYDAVFLVGLEEGLMPISHAKTDEEVDEERRLLYVGVTRARRWLWLTWVQKRPNRKGKPVSRRPSRFLYGLGPGAPKPGAKKKASGPTQSALADLPGDVDEMLVERLRDWRRERSRTDGVPAFVVFNDATLLDLAQRRPGSRTALLGVKGFGPAKADRYGSDVLAMIAGRPT
ncbi:MAG: ATP-dependent DNA helicase UvrD2 [Actinomycetota bacterium]